jgi:transcriptional regulator with XRE-family HTH domain
LLSQRALAKQAGVALKTVIDLELGRTQPHFGTMRKLSEALGVEPTAIDEFRQVLEEKVAA